MTKPRKDLTGKIFGRLTVIRQVDDYISPQGKHQPQWLCECNCEDKTQVLATSNNLKNGYYCKECVA